MDRSVLTIATGKPLFVRLAATLARSFRIWNADNGIGFAIATDQAEALPPDLDWVQVIPLQPGQYGDGFSPKLYLNELAPADRTLFVDADCLCVRDLRPAFEAFAGRPVATIGRVVSDGEWFGDVAAVSREFGVRGLPRFNGGAYYLERGEASDRVFEEAQALESHYDEIGFERLRGRPNDEVLMALAMAIHGLDPVPEDGTIMNSTLAAPAGVEVDVFEGRSRLSNPTGHPDHNAWYDQHELRPALVHFLGSEVGRYPYRREEVRLAKLAEGWPRPLATLWADLAFSAPWKARETFKDTFRSLYHRLVGVRAVRDSRSRVLDEPRRQRHHPHQRPAVVAPPGRRVVSGDGVPSPGHRR